ncbi:MAG: glycosyltransferase family 1 protein [Paludibacter sp.]|nr:glycosyltransferase family 1 protein [Paludibacter sp.]
MNNFLHIISFDIPYPPNYGGIIDVFYKIKSLHKNGIKIILHCFKYNDRQESEEIEKLCDKVYYYNRNTSLAAHFSYLPYTVFSRKSKLLLKRLQEDEHPILFEGLMSCYLINHKSLKNRIKIYRESNIEHDYYYELFKGTNNLKKKLFYIIESIKLKYFEKNIQAAALSLVVSTNDQKQLEERYPNKRIEFMPSFHANDEVSIIPGQSDYILYHGNLSVAENENAAIYLCNHVFSKLEYKCIISGLKPSQKLIKVISNFNNIKLIANPNKAEMEKLMQEAQVHILVTEQCTGLKLKLLNTLFSGRHIVVNSNMLAGSGLDNLCNIADTPEAQITQCNTLMHEPFSTYLIEKRKSGLLPLYSNSYHAVQLKDILSSLTK